MPSRFGQTALGGRGAGGIMDRYGRGGRGRRDLRDDELEFGDELRDLGFGEIDRVRGRDTPQIGRTDLDFSRQDAFRQRQFELADRLGRVASGQEAGAGELAARRGTARAVATQAAMARGGQGQNAALAARQASRNTANLGLAGAGQAQEAALRDQERANQVLAGVLGQGRGQDIGMATSDAQLQQARRMAQVQAELQQRGMNDAQIAQMMQQLFGMDTAEMNARLGLEAQRQANNDSMTTRDWLQVGGQVGGLALMASDKRAKKNIRKADKEVKSLLDRLSPHSYDYKDTKHGEGRHLGVMAQDLEKSPLGAAMVEIDEDGVKKVNYGKGMSTIVAALAGLNRRMNKVEGK